MTADELAQMNEALGPGVSEKDETYRPYCMICPTILRMDLQEGRGFKCGHCRNEIGFDLIRRPESRPSVFRTYEA